ncbi:MAG: alpha/beta hydrolase [Firmicutes bacterium]|nr:alpha/beta hydrolase [Bacillota bacterium]
MKLDRQSLIDRTLVKGSGPPVLFLHDAFGPGTWEYVIPELVDRYQVFCPVLPGFFVNDGKVEYDDFFCVEFVLQVLAALDLPRVIIAGCGAGARIALNFVLDHPNRVSRLIICQATGLRRNLTGLFPGASMLTKRMLSVLLADSKLVAALVRKGFVDKEHPLLPATGTQFAKYLEEPALRENIARLLAHSLSRASFWPVLLPSVAVRTLILWPTEDEFCPVSGGRELHQLLRYSDLKLLEGYGHFATVEAPGVFAEEIVSFATQ